MKKSVVIPKINNKNEIFKKLHSANPSINSQVLHIVFRMLTFLSQASQALEQHFQRYNLSQPGFLTLLILYSVTNREWTAIDLANELDVKPPTMTGILDTLEKGGYLNRIASKEDRRKNFIQLSSQGKSKFKKIIPNHFLKIMNAFSELPLKFEEEQEKVFSNLEKSLQKLTSDLQK